MWLSNKNDDEDKAKETTNWIEKSAIFKDFYFNITVSEFDREQRPIVYCDEKENLKRKSEFLNLISQYYIQTHKGISIS